MGRPKKIKQEVELVANDLGQIIEVEKLSTKTKNKTLIDKQINGKVYNKNNVSSIDELLGMRAHLYVHEDVEQYEMFLSSLNMTDLQDHATTVSVMPRENRDGLVRELIKEYNLKTNKFAKNTQVNVSNRKPISPELARILSQGR